MMRNDIQKMFAAGLLLVFANIQNATMAEDYQAAKWDPIHFKPNIETATDQQCLGCHQEILDRKTLKASPAGVKSDEVLAWYQTLNTYEGEQETFHRRHLVTDYSKKLMKLKCNTCHQGNDPREETANSSANSDSTLTQRKMVNPKTCLMCHGQFNWERMAGLTGPWPKSRDMFQNNCMICHAAIRTNRHQVNFLKADTIEQAGKTNGDVCYGCHGGRAWYRTEYPYPRHPWQGMAPEIPEWAKGRPTESEARFLETSK